MTNYSIKGEANYALRVIRVERLIDLPGLDNLKGVSVDGLTALVSKDFPVGTLAVVFPAEVQLAPEFASAHNLFRHAERNDDPSVTTGYLEDSARVRAIRLRGTVSSALLLPAADVCPDAPEGTLFDTIDGVTLSWKYEPPVRGQATLANQHRKMWKRVNAKFLPEHVDTANGFRFGDQVPDDAYVVITQKIHGTSGRVANTIVRRRLTWFERLLQRLGVAVQDTEYDYVYGSRHTLKDAENATSGFYGAEGDIWVTEGRKIAETLPRGFVVYCEFVGYLPSGRQIQKNYTYDAQKGQVKAYVYRVATITPDGILTDLSWPAVQEFCAERGLDTVRTVWEGFKGDFDPLPYMDKNLGTLVGGMVPLSPASPCDEGVVMRWDDSSVPRFWKFKSPLFLAHESMMLDSGEEVLN